MGKRNNDQVRKIDASEIMRFLSAIDQVTKESRHQASIVTFDSAGRDWQQVFDVNAEGDVVTWGYQHGYRQIIAAKLINPETYPLAVIARTFNGRWCLGKKADGKKMLFPGKDMRLFCADGPDSFMMLSPEEAFACMNQDADTGELLPLDATLTYV